MSNTHASSFSPISLINRTREDRLHGLLWKERPLAILSRLAGVFDVADPRDKIFGLSNLVRGGIAVNDAFRADYTKDVTQIYCEVSKAIIRESASLSILSIPRRSRGTGVDGLPSWVPDWTRNRRTAQLGSTRYGEIDDQTFNATRGSQTQVEIDEVTSSLRVWAHLVDRISAVGTILREDEVPRTCFRDHSNNKEKDKDNESFFNIPKCSYVFDDWTRVAGLPNQTVPYITGGSAWDAFAQTLVCGKASHVSGAALWAQLRVLEKYAAIARFVSSVPIDSDTPNHRQDLVDRGVSYMRAALFYDDDTRGNLDPGYEAHLAPLGDRRVFRTTRGYIGLGPALADVGDEVVLVKGASVPLVLRPRGGGAAARTLRGDCFIYGAMGGEAWNERDVIPIWIT